MLSRFLTPQTENAYAALRIVSGFLFMFHGIQKLFGLWTDHQPPVGSQMWIGGCIELVGGVLICVGLFTVIAAFIASGTMAVAYFQFHWKLHMGSEILPVVNKGEMAVLYCFIFVFIACRGPGRFSIDARRR